MKTEARYCFRGATKRVRLESLGGSSWGQCWCWVGIPQRINAWYLLESSAACTDWLTLLCIVRGLSAINHVTKISELSLAHVIRSMLPSMHLWIRNSGLWIPTQSESPHGRKHGQWTICRRLFHWQIFQWLSGRIKFWPKASGDMVNLMLFVTFMLYFLMRSFLL